MRALAAAFRLQLHVLRTDASQIQTLAMVPLFTIIFLQIVRQADRDDLTGYAVLAPALIAVWALALQSSGEVVEDDRWQGTLELVVGSPTPFSLVVLGRVLAVTLISLVAFGEVWFASWVVFGVAVEVHHPFEFALGILATAIATAGTATIMASLFIVTRSPRTFQNSLSWPFYVLGGVLVPVAFLPDWLEPAASVVFLSWSADLLRASLSPEPVDNVEYRLAVIVALGICGCAIGFALLARMLRQARRTATLGLA